jgi:hypothetical protein
LKKRLTLENNRDIFMLAMEVGLFFMPKIQVESNGGGSCAHENYISMHGMQAA